ncbi:MAG: heavy metal translocating P-type ATPase [Cyanobacteria bacterium P01_E01_bin.6]
MQTTSEDQQRNQMKVNSRTEGHPPKSLVASSVDESTALRSVITLTVDGMKCAGCVSAVEGKLMNHPTVLEASVNLVTTKATVTFAGSASDAHLIAANLVETISALGFPTRVETLPGDDNAGDDGSSAWGVTAADDLQMDGRSPKSTASGIRQDVVPLAIAIGLLLASCVGHLKHLGWADIPVLSSIWFHCGLATLALAWPGRTILLDGWRSLRHGIPNMNTLVGLGMSASYGASLIALLRPSLGWECFFDEPVMLVGFILLGRALEQHARTRAKQSIEALFARQPHVARLLPVSEKTVDRSVDQPMDIGLLTQMQSVDIPTQNVQVGQWLKVLPGDQVPVDGIIIAGRTTIDEAILTGESLPLEKTLGDRISAGSLNQSGSIAIQAIRVGRETTLSRMIQLVEVAQTRKAPVQKLADTVAGYFAYGVMAVAAMTFGFWYLVGTQLWPRVLMGGGHVLHHGVMAGGGMTAETSPLLLSLKLAIAVLVVACPCALGLATPTAIMVGSGIGAEQGLLIRGGDVLEKVHRLDTIVFDKTGTLTTGHPTVTRVTSLTPDFSEDDILTLAASAEQETQHPVGQAIQYAAEERSLSLRAVHDVQTESGSGVTAWVQDAPLYVGKIAWVRQHVEWDGDTQSAIDDVEMQAVGSVVLIALGQTVLGLVVVEDQLRDDAFACVAALQAMKIDVRVLTGDRQSAAAPIVDQLGLSTDALIAGVQPNQKSDVIQSLQHDQRVVCMVGDGMNDAPALAQADVGIAMHSGTDVAIETSDIVLMRDRLADVAESIHLGRRVVRKIRQNLFWALAYNTLGIPIAAGALLPAWGLLLSPANAGVLMAFSSVSVVVNALLLRRFTQPQST